MSIKFYSTNGEFGCFSNFSNHSIMLDNKLYKTSEHYFQCKKFAGTKYETEVRKCKGPMAAATMGRDRSLPLRKDWESIKDNVMRKAVLYKFMQNDDCRDVLLSSNEEELIEHTEKDSYWADGGNGTGKNMLGKILMEVRKIILDNDEIDKYITKYNLKSC